MISIFFNDEVLQIKPTLSLHDLLIQNNYVAQHFAVAINNQFVPRLSYSKAILHPGDCVDIIVPMQGG